MATEKEEIILDFKVEGGDLVTELEKLKKLITANKQEQIALNKAFRDGKITESEYAKESVRVENALKRQQNQYRETQKSVIGHKSKIDELIKSNNNLAKTNQNLVTSFKDAASNINVAGVNVGSLTSKLTAFSNPATAAVAVVGALGAAYARSTIGAKDLEFAQNQLSFATTIATNSFASLFSSAEDGEGALSKLLDTLFTIADNTVQGKALKLIGIDIAEIQKTSRELALLQDQLEDLGRTELEIRDKNNQRLEDNQELLTQLQAEQATFNDKIGITNQLITNLRDNETALVGVLNEELAIIQKKLEADEHNEAIQTELLLKKKEIGAVERDTEKRVQAILRMEQNITEEENKRISFLREDARIRARIANAPSEEILKQRDQNRFGVTRADSDATVANTEQERQIERQKTFEKAKVALTEDGIMQRIAAERLYTEFIEAEQQARLNATAGFFGALSSIFKQGSEEQKGLALFQIAVDSAVGVSGAIKAGAGVPFPGNLVAILTGVTAVLSGIGQARQLLGFKSGGYTGDGNPHDVAGVVHREEVVWNAQDVDAMGGPNVVNAMRPTAGRRNSRGSGYYDGGIVANNATKEIDTSLATINAIKNMPPPIVSAVEVTKAQRRVRVKEQISNR